LHSASWEIKARKSKPAELRVIRRVAGAKFGGLIVVSLLGCFGGELVPHRRTDMLMQLCSAAAQHSLSLRGALPGLGGIRAAPGERAKEEHCSVARGVSPSSQGTYYLFVMLGTCGSMTAKPTLYAQHGSQFDVKLLGAIGIGLTPTLWQSRFGGLGEYFAPPVARPPYRNSLALRSVAGAVSP